jgi:NAD(P)-dependent dehydrogenase (short-subunit alcohol dehydrogenase family)
MGDTAEVTLTTKEETTEIVTPKSEHPGVAGDVSANLQKDEPVYHRKYGSRTTALTVVEGMDLTGKTIMITGTTSGIGIETARTLALKGAHVVMANRNIIQSEQLRDKIYAEYPDAEKRNNIDLIHMDLSSLQSVQAAAKEFISKGWPLHVLVLNAGVIVGSSKTTIDGYETTFGVNHLGHFYLTNLLLEKLRENAPSRVVVVSSNSHNHTMIKPQLPTEEKVNKLIPDPSTTENGYSLYAYSKLCNVLFAQKLHRDEHKNGINVYVLHPGSMIGTNISRGYPIFSKIVSIVTKPFVKNLQQGAATTVYCAVSPDCENDSGKYYESCWDDENSLNKPLAHDVDFQDALWQKSLQLINKFEESRPGS